MKNPKITPEEIELIKKAQSGDISAFNRIFKRYKPFVDNVLFQYIKDMDEAKDMTNIVFLKVYDKLSTFTAYNSFGGWLRVIANRTAIDYLREMYNKSTVLGTEFDKLSVCASMTTNENDLIGRLTYEQILELLDSFPEKVRHICRLFYVEGLTVEQISETLSTPTGTIKSILSRTRKQLKNKLQTF